ncbi:MAG: hypothetical protein M3511_15015, partial [Deinococcota bacterium]|nr:hypothetical protein [Deinococcota bacterium]
MRRLAANGWLEFLLDVSYAGIGFLENLSHSYSRTGSRFLWICPVLSFILYIFTQRVLFELLSLAARP